MKNLRPNVLSRILALSAGTAYARDRWESFEVNVRSDAPCSVLCADPAWLFNDKLPGSNRGAAKNYREQHIDDIINKRGFEFEFPTLADDCILFLWRVGSQQQEALDVATGWGFEVKGEIIWNKLTKKGKPWFGMGRIQRQSHETCLVATRGRSANVVINRGTRSTFEAPVPTYEKGHPRIGKPLLDKHGQPTFHKKTGKQLVTKVGDYVHSGKPEKFYTDIVERICRGPYVELFGRRTRLGWSVRGNEVWNPETGSYGLVTR